MSREITGLIIAKNEAVALPGCLENWSQVCDELIVVDDESVDDTPAIAAYMGAKVIPACMNDKEGFAGLRNIGLEAVQTSDVLIFDADETPNKALLASIERAIRNGDDGNAYRLRRRNAAFGGWLDNGRFGPDWQTRLFGSDIRYTGAVHETPVMPAETQIEDLAGHVDHMTYGCISEYKSKMKFYAEKQAGISDPPSMAHMLGIPLKNLLVKKGYKDGWRGLAMALGDGWYDHLVRKYSA